MKSIVQSVVRGYQDPDLDKDLTDNHNLLVTDWDTKSEYHIELWTGLNTAQGVQDQIDCIDRLPGGMQTIILDPPNGLPVDSMLPTTLEFDWIHALSFTVATPLIYNQPSNQCRAWIQQSSTSNLSRLCAGGLGSGSPAPVSSASSKAPVKLVGAPYTPSTLFTLSAAVPSSAASAPASCIWNGHCRGAPCHSLNDCSGTDVCTDGVCAACTGGSWC